MVTVSGGFEMTINVSDKLTFFFLTDFSLHLYLFVVKVNVVFCFKRTNLGIKF